MQKMSIAALGLCLLLCVTITQQSLAATLDEAKIQVFADGIIHFKALISVDETEASVTLPFIAPPNRIFNILAVDEEGSLLSYDINEHNITINSLGATLVTLEYDTDYLTMKEAGLWTLSFYAPFEVDVTLPENSTIIYISTFPTLVSAEDGSVKLSLTPGFWEISYEVAIQSYPSTSTPTPSTPTSPKPTPQQPTAPAPIPLLGIAAGAAVGVFSVGLIVYFRRKRSIATLRLEEVEVLKFIKDRGGRALEAELREAFPDIPRTSMWRLIKRLERRGKVKVKKVGLQNIVELV